MKCSVIAELSCNHNGSFEKAQELIEAAHLAGASAVKCQMFEPNEMTLDCNNENFVIEHGLWSGKKLIDLYKEAQTPLHWIPDLMESAAKKKMSFVASVYHPNTVELAELFKVKIYKISSFELNYKALLEEVAKTKKPIILSTGMATEDEIQKAIDILAKHGSTLILLKCTSKYPAPMSEMNLLTIPYMSKRFGLPIGLSDHTRGIVAPIVAVSYGAMVIEKHLCLDRDCLDGEFSVTPNKLKKMINAIRMTEESLGEIKFDGEVHFRRSMVAMKNIKKGEELNGNIGCFRTVTAGFTEVEKIASKNYKKGELICC